MRLKAIHIIYVVLATLLCACTTDELTQLGERQSGFYLTLGDAITDVVVTRSTPSQLGAPLQEDFQLSIVNDATQTAVYDGRYRQFVEAGNGSYTITAKYGSDVTVALDKPYYIGVAHATIDAQNLTPSVDIQCAVGNALVSVRYLDGEGHESTANFEELFSDYGVQIWRGEQYVTLVDGKSAYFKVGDTPRLVLVGTLRDIDREVTFDIESSQIPATMSAADHLILSLSLAPSTAGVMLDVVKAEVEKVTVEETIPLEWLPAPKLSVFGGKAHLTYIESTTPQDNAVIDFSTSHNLQEMELTLDFDDAALSVLNDTYILSQLTNEQSERLAAHGIALPQLDEVITDGQIDLRSIISTLQTNNGSKVSNTVSVRLKANNRWAESAAIINTVRPIFNMPKHQPGYAWSHSIYIMPLTNSDVVDAQGAELQDMIDNLVYEISADDGATWTEVTTTADEYACAQGLTPEANYQLRARIGSALLSATTEQATTEAQNPVPNGDFETLNITYNNQTINQGGQYRRTAFGTTYGQNTQTFTVSEPTGWASTNAKTCNLSASTKNSWFCPLSVYNTTINFQTNEAKISGLGGTTINPDIYCSQSAQSGSNAMVIRNVAYSANGSVPGRYTNTAATPGNNYYSKNTPDISNTAAGKMFLGSYAFAGGTETFTEGVSFTTRPTALKGYYKYDISNGSSSDQGLVTVTLLNGTNVVATGSANLAEARGYTEFSVPLTYSDIATKATSLRVMISSAANESNIATTKIAEYIQEAYGSVLCIDNLTFTYDK